MLDIILKCPHGVCSIDDVSRTGGHINVDSIFQLLLKIVDLLHVLMLGVVELKVVFRR